ncbi:glycosyltransferase [Ferrimonas senticii]|uniref:glycosyltransferase n=1 Tax=Ferrimonas senticii TaxID=394566 RepID=UPI0003FCABC5|nr:glycosyltransferase [Ferrimonas senticii]
MTTISVCLCTYKRPQLADTLASLQQLRLPPQVTLEISIADNDPNGSGQVIVEQFKRHCAIPVHYQIQPQKNIALTRNVSVANASGDWLAFIDDDEEADDDWLLQLYRCAQQYHAAAVVGQVVTLYPQATPEWIRRGDLLGRRCRDTGTELTVGLTGNSLVRRSALPHPSTPFDPKLGTTGGEDSAFFSAIHRSGGRIIACQQAIVRETAELHRLNADYLLKQSTRVGETYAINFISPQPSSQRYWMGLKALIRATTDLLTAVVLRPFGRHLSFRYRMGMHIQLGKLRHLMNANPIEMYK